MLIERMRMRQQWQMQRRTAKAGLTLRSQVEQESISYVGPVLKTQVDANHVASTSFAFPSLAFGNYIT